MAFVGKTLLFNISKQLSKTCGAMAYRQQIQGLTIVKLVQQTDTMLPKAVSCFHTSSQFNAAPKKWFSEPTEFLKYNDIVYPPQKEGEPPRPAEVVHQRTNVKYSVKKMFYLCLMIRGLTVDEALKQLQFHVKDKGARIISEVIKEAQEIAVKDHNVEYKSNLWIEHAFTEKAHTIKGLRKHARMRYNVIRYRYLHFFIRLREGSPPKHYYKPQPDGNEKMEEYLQGLRNRTIIRSL